MNQISIEDVTEKDTAELLELYAPYVEKTAISFEYEVPSVEEFRERIHKIIQRYPYIKAVNEKGTILGYAYASTFKDRKAYDRSVETTVYVKQDCRRHGIGKVLYEKLEEKLKKIGILNMNACIAVTDHEDDHLTNDSVFFHQSMGFEMVGTFHGSGYKFGIWYDMVWMEKLIGEHICGQ